MACKDKCMEMTHSPKGRQRRTIIALTGAALTLGLAGAQSYGAPTLVTATPSPAISTTITPPSSGSEESKEAKSTQVAGVRVAPGVAYVHAVDPISDTNRSAIYLGSNPSLVISCADGDKRRLWSYLEGSGKAEATSAWVRFGNQNAQSIKTSSLVNLNGAVGFDSKLTKNMVSQMLSGKKVTLRVDTDTRNTIIIEPSKHFATAWKKIGSCQSHRSK